MSTLEPTTDIVVSLARGRYAVMSRANALLSSSRGEAPATADQDLQALSGLLMTALEELKVAEEELRVQNATLEAQRAGVDERTRHYRHLFLCAPVAAVVTDTYGTIVEANAEAAALLRRDLHHLERKPMAAFVPVDYRDAFRRQFSLLASVNNEVKNWAFPILRNGDVPLKVHATVRLVPDLGPVKTGAFYWVFREGGTY